MASFDTTPEKICSNCKYWNTVSHTVKFGKCALSMNRSPQSMMRSSCGLQTNERFGCNQFSAKTTS